MPVHVPTDSELADHAGRVARWMIAHRQTLATAESCTGGWIAKTLTDLPGSSTWFAGGVVSYSNAVKQALLGVQTQTLIDHGAVSAECAREMVSGVRERFDTDLAVAVTGIAGPTGGTMDKPVGSVWIAWQERGTPPRARLFRFDGDRSAVRRQAVATALTQLLLPAD
jgi:nicotinamide-nucleotide amidase